MMDRDRTRWGDTRWTEFERGQRHIRADKDMTREERRAVRQALAIVAVAVAALLGAATLAALIDWPGTEAPRAFAMHH